MAFLTKSCLKEVNAVLGDSILAVAHANDIDLEGGMYCDLSSLILIAAQHAKRL